MSEIRFLENNYDSHSRHSIAKLLGRSPDAISVKACYLGLRKNSHEKIKLSQASQKKILRAFKIIKVLYGATYSVRGIAQLTDIPERAVFVYLALLDTLNIGLKRVGPYHDVKYTIDKENYLLDISRRINEAA
jgi:hypothetical protein